MKRRLASVCLVLVSIAIGWTLADSRRSALDEVKQLEHQSWEAWKHQDAETIRRLTASDYLSSDGERVTDFAEELRYVPLTVVKSYQPLAEMKVLQVSADVVVVFYPLKLEATEAGKDISGRFAIASVWVRRDGKWLNAFVHEVPMKE